MKSLLFAAVGLVIFSYSVGHGCVIELYREIRRCDALWGRNGEAAVSSEGQAYNITQLVRYCRNPSGERVGDCMRQAYSRCDPRWGDEERPTFEAQVYLMAKGMEYLCSEVDEIENDESCLMGVSQEMTECERASLREFDESFRELVPEDGPLPWSDNRRLLERMGRSKEQCVRDLLTNQCNSELGDIFSNFVYGVAVHAYDYANRNKR